MKQRRVTSLSDYRAKRDLRISPEPKATRNKRTSGHSLSFCIQKHLASHLHYDFRLEFNGVLLSWAIPKGPSLNPADKRMAVRTEDHPIEYGDFEGIIPSGYGAGIVLLWDRGIWVPEQNDIAEALRKGELKFSLDGVKLKGSWVLVRTGLDAGREHWLLIKHRDFWSGPLDITIQAPLSVKSFGDLADLLRQSDQLAVWSTHPPVKTGATGALFQDVLRQARRQSRREVHRQAAK